jgi:hypothetical protein
MASGSSPKIKEIEFEQPHLGNLTEHNVMLLPLTSRTPHLQRQ